MGDKFEVKDKWDLDNGGSIYHILERLFFYNAQQDPCWKKGQMLEKSEISATDYYKQRVFTSWDDIPNDCSRVLQGGDYNGARQRKTSGCTQSDFY